MSRLCQEYWAEVRGLQRELAEQHPDGVVYIVTGRGSMCRVVDASPETAARNIVDGVARLATVSEIDALRVQQAAAAASLRRAEERYRSHKPTYLLGGRP